MFPSTNYFRDIPCPFFSRVSCPRPHCHFKHAQMSSQSTNINSTTSSSSSSIHIPADANETLNKLISQLSSAAAAANTPAVPTVNPTPSVDLTSILQSTLLQSLSSVLANTLTSTPPTTSSNSLKPDVTEKPSQSTNTKETIPEYRPTPIAELERRKRVQQQQQQQQTIKPNNRSSLNSDEYVRATFSPPSTSPPSPPAPVTQPEPVEELKAKVSTIPKPTASTFTDNNHSWVTPPARQKLSSSSDHHDLDERKASPIKKLTPFEKSQPLIKKPTATVKPNVIENTTKTVSSTNPLLKPIPKKTTPTKVRISDTDLEKVPVTPTLSLDEETISNKSKTSSSLKRTSNGSSEIPQKKPRIVPKPVGQTIQTKMSSTNGTRKTTDEDDELALFDQAFSPAKTSTSTRPLNSVQQLLARYSSQTSVSSDSTNQRTRAETSSDGRRIAHQPKASSNIATPSMTSFLQPLIDGNSNVHKIPLKTRQEYLTFFINELKKKSTNLTNLTRAQTIEKEIFDKSTNKNSYLNLAAKYLRQLRTEEIGEKIQPEPIAPKKPNTQRLIVSHSAMLTTGNAENVSFGIKKKKNIDFQSLTENELYTFLLAHKASERDLTENGYPAFSLDFPDKVLIKTKNPLYNSAVKTPSSDPFTRICCRCGKTYKINQDGEYIKQEQCIYHWGRTVSQRVAGQIEKTYSCCSSKTNTVGCAVAPYHVHDADESQLLSGYVKTQPLKRQLNPTESYGIFALDCEMCYTINGLELVRVSVIDRKLKSIYETLVKPHAQILDYNTRWSGITEEHLKDCQVTLEDVQRRLLKLFNSKTILIGHSLESDLKALKIVHETIVDTSLVFPHAKGKPYKRALKTLTSEYLHKIIQENVDGHDSLEDAVASMELMLWKVKQDLKHS